MRPKERIRGKCVVPVAAAVAAVAVWVLARPAGRTGPAAARPAATQPARANPVPPATTPAPPRAAAAEPYPSEQLAAACRRRAEEIAAALAPDGKTIIRPPFVIGGDEDERRLDSYAHWSVVRPAKAMWTAYFDKKPTEPIAIVLFAGEKNYRRYARRDYPEGGEPYFGYYVHHDRRMVMNIRTGTGTLVHELTHALVAYDFPGVPSWFNEALASLHEQCNVQEEGIVGLTNWRLPALQKAVAAGELRPLRELLTQRDFYGPQQGLNYAQGRYFVMYMQDCGLLRKFYRHFRQNHEGQGADVKAVEHILGRPIDEVEKAFLAWVKTLKFGG